MTLILEYDELFNHVDTEIESLILQYISSKVKLINCINEDLNVIDYNIKFNTFKNSALIN
jgi:hypothetical protein